MTQDEWRMLLAETLTIAEELERSARWWRRVAGIFAGILLGQIIIAVVTWAP